VFASIVIVVWFAFVYPCFFEVALGSAFLFSFPYIFIVLIVCSIALALFRGRGRGRRPEWIMNFRVYDCIYYLLITYYY